MQKIAFGFVWFLLFYLASCMLLGAVAGAFAGVAHPEIAVQAGQVAGRHIVAEWRLYLFIGAVALSIAGAIKGWLPGTKPRKLPSTGEA